MTEILFYHLQDTTIENVLPPLLEKSIERGWRVAVQTGSDERAEALDGHLWTYRENSFLPHGTWRESDAPDQPILLVPSEDNLNNASVRFIVDAAGLPKDCATYERVVLVFDGNDDDALASARSAWTDSKSRGFDMTYWQMDDRGKWQRRES